MGRVHDGIDERLAEWIGRQAVFFVATAPARDEGRVNLSPKGLDTFRVLGPDRVGYLDLTGSGVETIAHLRADGRITIMFCAFEGPPRIVRLYGTGSVVEIGDAGWDDASAPFPAIAGGRAVISVAVDRVSDSCGYAVPLMDHVGPRTRLVDWAEGKGDEGLDGYRAEKNVVSIDGLSGFARAADGQRGSGRP